MPKKASLLRVGFPDVAHKDMLFPEGGETQESGVLTSFHSSRQCGSVAKRMDDEARLPESKSWLLSCQLCVLCNFLHHLLQFILLQIG